MTQAASKLTAIARTPARRLELITLHLDGSPHRLDALGIAAGLPDTEKRCGNATRMT